MENELIPHAKPEYTLAAEFTALCAFELGLRTGRGPADSFTA
ncbi:hypothetical protein AALC17_01055 [Oscillospiraceae bacterium 38-13]